MANDPLVDTTVKTSAADLEALFKAVEDKGGKLRLRELRRFLSLLSIGSALWVAGLAVTIVGSAYGMGAKFAVDPAPGPTATRNVGWGRMQGGQATDSFVAGGDATKLVGTWDAKWWVDLPSGGEEAYSYLDSSGKRVAYPTEAILLQAQDAIVSAKVAYSSGENIWYWYEGRLSAANHLTLLYWVERGDGREKLVGVVFAEFEEGMLGNRPSVLKGRWIGYVRDGKQVEGRTEWTKK